MRQLLFICILVFHTLGQAQHQELNSDLNDTNETAIPVVTKPDSNGESTLAFVAADNSKPTELSPDALTIWRSEYLKFQNQQQSTTTDNGVFLNTTKRFPKESLMFFVAIGGVTFNSMWIKSHGDPLALEKHIMSIKDPIAHLSFFAFMQSQGFYTDFFTKRAGPNISDTAR
jgi:hypothetical protein